MSDQTMARDHQSQRNPVANSRLTSDRPARMFRSPWRTVVSWWQRVEPLLKGNKTPPLALQPCPATAAQTTPYRRRAKAVGYD